MDLRHLPPEILEKILKLLWETDDYQLTDEMLVCKSWHTLCAKFTYRKICLTKARICRSKTKAICSRYGHLVKTLHIKPSGDGSLKKALVKRGLHTFLFAFPRLEEFCYNEVDAFEYCMKELISAQSFLFHLRCISACISDFKEKGYSKIHYITCYTYRSTISDLTVRYNQLNIFHEGTNIIDRLREFPLLSRLVFDTEGVSDVESAREGEEQDPSYQKSDMQDLLNYATFPKVLMSAPDLTDLTFCTSHSVPDSILMDHFQQLRFSHAKSKTTLLHLKLSLPSITQPYIEYLTFRAPASLTELVIKNTQITFHKWAEQVGMDQVLLLCKRLNRLRACKLSFREDFDNRFTPDRLYSISTPDGEQESNHSLFYRLVASIKGSRPLLCSIRFFIGFSRQKITVDPNSHLLSLEYSFKFLDFAEVHPAEVEDKVYNYDAAPFFDNLHAYPSLQLHDVHFLFSDGSSFDFIFPHTFLDTLIQHCPRLQNCVVCILFAFGEEAQIQFGKDYSNRCPTIKDPKEIEEFEDTQSAMRYLDLSLISLDTTSEFWPRIASYLPSSKKITCSANNSFHDREKDIPPEELPVHITWDFSHFSDLQVFFIDVNCIVFDSSISLFAIKFTYNDDSLQEKKYLISKIEESSEEEIWSCVIDDEQERNFSGQKCYCITVILNDNHSFDQLCILHNYFSYVIYPYKNQVLYLSDDVKYNVYTMSIEDHQNGRFGLDDNH